MNRVKITTAPGISMLPVKQLKELGAAYENGDWRIDEDKLDKLPAGVIAKTPSPAKVPLATDGDVPPKKISMKSSAKNVDAFAPGNPMKHEDSWYMIASHTVAADEHDSHDHHFVLRPLTAESAKMAEIASLKRSLGLATTTRGIAELQAKIKAEEAS